MLVHEPRQSVEVGARDLLGGLERRAAGEDREAGERLGLVPIEETMAPLDRCPQGALAIRKVARTAAQEVQRLREPGLQLRRLE